MPKQASKAQSKPDKQQCLLLMQAIQQTPANGAIVASKDGKRYLRSKGSK